MRQLQRFGFWWRENSCPDLGVLVHGAFSLEEARTLYDQFSECARTCINSRTYLHKMASIGRTRFYVLIDSDGAINLPLDKDQQRIKTSDPRSIPGFKSNYF